MRTDPPDYSAATWTPTLRPTLVEPSAYSDMIYIPAGVAVVPAEAATFAATPPAAFLEYIATPVVALSARSVTRVAEILRYTRTAVPAFCAAVAAIAPTLLRWLLRRLTAARAHAPRRWALPRFRPLELARAIHAPPGLVAAIPPMGGKPASG